MIKIKLYYSQSKLNTNKTSRNKDIYVNSQNNSTIKKNNQTSNSDSIEGSGICLKWNKSVSDSNIILTTPKANDSHLSKVSFNQANKIPLTPKHTQRAEISNKVILIYTKN